LQRRLTEQKTSFRQELDVARVRLAQRLLLESETSVTEVAIQVGLTSPQHLSTLFRKLGHASPCRVDVVTGEHVHEARASDLAAVARPDRPRSFARDVPQGAIAAEHPGESAPAGHAEPRRRLERDVGDPEIHVDERREHAGQTREVRSAGPRQPGPEVRARDVAMDDGELQGAALAQVGKVDRLDDADAHGPIGWVALRA
jgi:AraC-like DNA-binding protein